MAKATFRERIPVITSATTHPAAGVITQVSSNGNNQLKTVLVNGFNAKPLHFQGLADKLLDKHEFLLS